MTDPLIVRVTRLEEIIKNLREIGNIRHTDNLEQFTEVKHELKEVNHTLGNINIKMARWAGAGGILTAVAIEVFHWLIHK